MSGSFQTGTASIDLSGAPWNVTAVVKLFVLLHTDGTFELYKDEGCTQEFDPAEMPVWENVSTGLYFYIAAGSPITTYFCDGENGRPLPITWLSSDQAPPTVTYGKIRLDRKAFSMSDLATSSQAARYSFDLEVDTPSGVASVLGHLRRRRRDPGVTEIDPTIVEKGEEPPGGGG